MNVAHSTPGKKIDLEIKVFAFFLSLRNLHAIQKIMKEAKH